MYIKGEHVYQSEYVLTQYIKESMCLFKTN